MKVLLTSAYDSVEPLHTLRRCATLDRFRIHEPVNDPDQADLILFVENSHYEDDYFYSTLTKHPWVKRFRNKSQMYNEQDRPSLLMPGLYVSMPRNRFDHDYQRACAFIQDLNEYVAASHEQPVEPHLLYSFMGQCRTKTRARLLAADLHGGLIEDTSDFRPYSETSDVDQATRQKQRYADTIAHSKFVLCPLGVGTATYRVFEAMSAGRAPVVISDQWVPPSGPNWREFAVFIGEKALATIDQTLRSIETTWAERGARARAAWEQWFAPNVRYHRMVEECAAILNSVETAPHLSRRRVTAFELYMRTRVAIEAAARSAKRLSQR